MMEIALHARRIFMHVAQSPYMTACILIVLLLVTLILLVYARGAVKKSDASSEKNRDVHSLEHDKQLAKTDSFTLPKVPYWLAESLYSFHFLKVCPMVRDFLALSIALRGGYQTQSIVLVLSRQKCTFLESEEVTSGRHRISSAMFKVFDDASYVLADESLYSDTYMYHALCETLVYFRPSRPLDSIMAVMDLHALLSGQTHLSSELEMMRERVELLQEKTQLQIPLYIVFAGLESITGFDSFCSYLSDEDRARILGYSFRYDVQEQLCSSVTEMFDEIDKQIERMSDMLIQPSDYINIFRFRMKVRKLCEMFETAFHMLRRRGYGSDDMLCRGMYFIGYHKVCSAVLLSPQALLHAHQPSQARRMMSGWCFVHDLLSQKISQEVNLARPLYEHENVRGKVWNWCMSCIVAVHIIGWIIADMNILPDIARHYTLLQKNYTKISQIRVLEKQFTEVRDIQQLHNAVRDLLRDLDDLYVRYPSSLWIWQSWLWSDKSCFKDLVTLVYDELLLKAFFYSLMSKMRSIEYVHSNVAAGKKDALNIIHTRAFLDLEKYIQTIVRIEDDVSRYNELRHCVVRSDIAKLSKDLLGEEFPIANLLSQHRAERRCAAPELHMNKYAICDHVAELFHAFLRTTFDSTIEKLCAHVLQSVDEVFDLVADRKTWHITKPMRSEDLQRITFASMMMLRDKIDILLEVLNSAEFSWISHEKFCPHERYALLLAALERSNIFNAAFVQSLFVSAQKEFSIFKKHISAYHNKYIGPLLEQYHASSALQVFAQELHHFCMQSFCVETSDDFLPMHLEPDHLLCWDRKSLDDLIIHISEFKGFCKDKKSFRKETLPIYHALGLQCMSALIKDTLANALSSQKMIVDEGSLTDVLKSLARDIPLLQQIACDWNDIHSVRQLERLMQEHCLRILQYIDHYVAQESLYELDSNVFSAWDGKSAPSLYGLTRSNEHYMMQQRERLEQIVRDFVQPVLLHINRTILRREGLPMDLYDKWQDIANSLQQYQRNKPGNPLLQLENWVLNELPTITLENFDTHASLTTEKHPSGLFFLKQKQTLIAAMRARCNELNGANAKIWYQKLSEYFNANIADKFPFSDSFEKEVELVSLKKLSTLYATGGEKYIAVLQKCGVDDKVIKFLRNLDQCMRFFSLWNEEGNVQFTFQGRPSPRQETYSSSVLQRALLINAQMVADDVRFVYRNGDSIELQLHWAHTDGQEPYVSKNDTVMSIKDDVISFRFTGNWALWRMLAYHTVQRDKNGLLLQLKLPLQVNGAKVDGKVLLRLVPMLRNASGNWNVMAWPSPVRRAPSLNLISQNRERKR